MSYGIWLSFNNQQEGFQLPVNPASIEMSDGNKGKTYDISNLGEINVISNPKLTTYGFSSFLPGSALSAVLLSVSEQAPFLATNLLLAPVVVNNVKTNAYVHFLTK